MCQSLYVSLSVRLEIPGVKRPAFSPNTSTLLFFDKSILNEAQLFSTLAHFHSVRIPLTQESFSSSKHYKEFMFSPRTWKVSDLGVCTSVCVCEAGGEEMCRCGCNMHDQNKCRAGETMSKCARSLEAPVFLNVCLSACLYTLWNLFQMGKKGIKMIFILYKCT